MAIIHESIELLASVTVHIVYDKAKNALYVAFNIFFKVSVNVRHKIIAGNNSSCSLFQLTGASCGKDLEMCAPSYVVTAST